MNNDVFFKKKEINRLIIKISNDGTTIESVAGNSVDEYNVPSSSSVTNRVSLIKIITSYKMWVIISFIFTIAYIT